MIENILIGLHGPGDDWAMRLEGAIQCVRLSEITLEHRKMGIFLDAHLSGVCIDIHNLWNYDVPVGSQGDVLRVLTGSGVNVRNVFGGPSSIFVGSKVRNIRLEDIMARSVTVEDPKASHVILSHVAAAVKGPGPVESEDEFRRPRR